MRKNQKCLNLKLKMTYLGIFGIEFKKKTLFIYEISTLKFLKLKNFAKNKIPYIWHQKCLISVFLGYSFKKVLSYFKSAPLNLPNCKTL